LFSYHFFGGGGRTNIHRDLDTDVLTLLELPVAAGRFSDEG
jgi:hypothetical protein